MTGKDGLAWFRVQLLPGQQPPGQAYPALRNPPDVFGADSCRSIYGNGVGAGGQPGALNLLQARITSRRVISVKDPRANNIDVIHFPESGRIV